MAAALRGRFMWCRQTALPRIFQSVRQCSANKCSTKWRNSPADCWMNDARQCFSYTAWSCNATSAKACTQCCRQVTADSSEKTIFSGHETILAGIREIIKSNTPDVLSDSSRQQVANHLHTILRPHSKNIVTAVLRCCPYYAAMHDQPEAAAEHNQLWVVYAMNDKDFYGSPLTASNSRIPASIEYDGWLRVIELKEFISHVVNGQTNHVESLLAPAGCHITHDLDWTVMRHKLSAQSWHLMSHGFVIRALRQMHTLALTENGEIRDDATSAEWCTVMRLLGHFDALALQHPLTVWQKFPYKGLPRNTDVEPNTVVQALYASHTGVLDRRALQEYVSNCFNQYPLTTATLKKHTSRHVKPDVAAMLFQYVLCARLRGFAIQDPPVYMAGLEEAASILAKYKDSLRKVLPSEIDSCDVLHHCATGAQLHNVYIEDRDEKTALLLYRFKTAGYIVQLHDRHDKSVLQELRADNAAVKLSICDARWFAVELLKGSVDIIELLFSDNKNSADVFSSRAFQLLCSRRKELLTETVIDNYVAFVENCLSTLASDLSEEEASDQLYLAFHKLSEIERLLDGQPPLVRCDGQLQKYLLNVRKGPHTGDFSIGPLKEKAASQLAELKTKRSRRSKQLPEVVPADMLTRWLTGVVYPLKRSESTSQSSQRGDLINALLSPIDADVSEAEKIAQALGKADHQGVVDFFDDSVQHWKENVDPFLPNSKIDK